MTLTLLVDSREPKETFAKIQKKLSKLDVETKFEFLDISDYLFPEVAIERKRNDIITSLMSKRIFEQLYNLKEYENPILVITTPNIWKLFYKSKSKYIDKAYFGFLASCILDFKIPVIKLDDDDEFVELLFYIAKNLSSEGKSTIPVTKPKKSMSIEKKRIYMLAQTDGLGFKKAKEILNKYGSIAKLSKASVKELQKFEGVGKKIAQNIYDMLH